MGKSRTIGLFAEWLFGKDKTQKIMTGSYNETLSTVFSKGVRNSIQEEKADEDKIVYSDIFPDTKIKRGDGSMNMWSLEGGYNNYLATSPHGSATGFGANCFTGDTHIYTELGAMTISELFDKDNIRVLSYDHESNMLRYNKIKAKRRIISNDFIEVETNTSRRIKATAEHRFYTNEEGYIEARQLREGYTVKTCEIQRKMQTMWRAKKGLWRTMQGLLQQEQNSEDRLSMCLLQQRISTVKVSIQKGNIKRLSESLLYKDLFMQSQCRESENESLQNLWRICNRQQKILFRQMQRTRNKSIKEIKRYRMSNLQGNVQTSFEQNSLLFNRMSRQSTCRENERQRQLKLQAWKMLSKRVQRFEGTHKRERQSQLSNMWCGREDVTKQKIWNNDKSINSSQGRGQAQQRFRQSNNSMQIMSFKIAQDETITKITPYRKTEYVYDIQVEKDSNFFANGVLVHNCMIIDDLIKNAEESFNDKVLDDHFLWFCQTMLSRLEEGGKIILVMTRWSSKDLAGRCIQEFKDRKMKLIVKKAMQDDGTMLCEDVLSKDSFLKKAKLIGEHITSANYQQIPIDLQGALYRRLQTYEELPCDENNNLLFECIRAYCDTADEGADFLCNIIYGIYDKQAYILDVYYTQEHMEVTEKEVAKRLYEHNVNIADIESNNGGKGFARNVQRILRETYNTRKVSIRWFHQTKNKKARILTASSWIQDNVFFPNNWSQLWSEFYRDVISYQKAGKNKHDDCVDALSSLYEKIEEADAILF